VARSIVVLRTAAIAAYRPFQRVPATVSFLNLQRTLVPGGGNWSSCPKPAMRDGAADLQGVAVSQLRLGKHIKHNSYGWLKPLLGSQSFAICLPMAQPTFRQHWQVLSPGAGAALVLRSSQMIHLILSEAEASRVVEQGGGESYV
jgi:hypothetical protein